MALEFVSKTFYFCLLYCQAVKVFVYNIDWKNGCKVFCLSTRFINYSSRYSPSRRLKDIPEMDVAAIVIFYAVYTYIYCCGRVSILCEGKIIQHVLTGIKYYVKINVNRIPTLNAY